MAVRHVEGVQKVEGNAREKTVVVQIDSQVASVGDIKATMARSDMKLRKSGSDTKATG